jgi:hypothetical protein
MNKTEPDYIGKNNPLDEREEHIECHGCGFPMYSDETVAGDDGEEYCGDCIALGFEDTVRGGVVFKGKINGKFVFEIGESNEN